MRRFPGPCQHAHLPPSALPSDSGESTCPASRPALKGAEATKQGGKRGKRPGVWLRINERQLEAARIRREREKLDLERQAELRLLNEKQQQERQVLWQRQRAEEDRLRRERQEEEDRLRRQRQMEADILSSARAGKQRLIDEFYRDAVIHLNQLLEDVTGNVLENLEQGGKLRGPISAQLRQFIIHLERLNFVADEQIESQLARLRAALPTEEQSQATARGLQRIDTKPLERVVRQVRQEADDLLLELGVSVPSRLGRARNTSGEELEALPALDGQVRQPRAGMASQTAAGEAYHDPENTHALMT